MSPGLVLRRLPEVSSADSDHERRRAGSACRGLQAWHHPQGKTQPGFTFVAHKTRHARFMAFPVVVVLQGNQMTLVFMEREYSSPEEPHLGIVHMVEVSPPAHVRAMAWLGWRRLISESGCSIAACRNMPGFPLFWFKAWEEVMRFYSLVTQRCIIVQFLASSCDDYRFLWKCSCPLICLFIIIMQVIVCL